MQMGSKNGLWGKKNYFSNTILFTCYTRYFQSVNFWFWLVLETPISEFFHSQQRSTQPSSGDINTENDSMTKCQVCVKSQIVITLRPFLRIGYT